MEPEDEGSKFDPELMLAQVLQDPAVSQFLIRHRFETEEALSVHVRCDFGATQQRYILHVPFYPHFSSIPEVNASIFDDTDGRVRVTDQQKFGTRVEITLDKPVDSPKQVLVEVIATASISVDPGSSVRLLQFQPRQLSD